jgi:hypothetical protein
MVLGRLRPFQQMGAEGDFLGDVREARTCAPATAPGLLRKMSEVKGGDRIVRIYRILVLAAVSIALLPQLAVAQTTWTCQKFGAATALSAKFQSLTPSVQGSAKTVVRQFQTVAQLRAGGAALAVDTTTSAPAAAIPGAQLGHMLFIDQFDLLSTDSGGNVSYRPLASVGAVADALNGLSSSSSDSAKIIVEQFAAQQKKQKAARLGQMRLENQYVLFYLATFGEAATNACGTVEPPPPPTATATAASTPTATAQGTTNATTNATPTATSSPTSAATGTPTSVATGTPTAGPTGVATATATAGSTPTSTGQATPVATPTDTAQASPSATPTCVLTLGNTNNCPVDATPTATVADTSQPTPTPTCVVDLGNTNNCPEPTPTSTATSECFIGLGGVLICNGPTPTATATP